MIGNEMLRGIGIKVPAPCMDTVAWLRLASDEREFGGDMDDRAVMEAHGIDVDCTPVDTFMDRDMGYCLCPED